jgi:hypothetical protein
VGRLGGSEPAAPAGLLTCPSKPCPSQERRGLLPYRRGAPRRKFRRDMRPTEPFPERSSPDAGRPVLRGRAAYRRRLTRGVVLGSPPLPEAAGGAEGDAERPVSRGLGGRTPQPAGTREGTPCRRARRGTGPSRSPDPSSFLRGGAGPVACATVRCGGLAGRRNTGV